MTLKNNETKKVKNWNDSTEILLKKVANDYNVELKGIDDETFHETI